MLRVSQNQAIPRVRPWSCAQTARCAGMRTGMPVSKSVSVFSLGIPTLVRKSLKLLGHVSRGYQKIQVFLAPRMPNAQRNHLFPGQGAEKETGMAPPRRARSGWKSAPHLCLLNYGCSPSSGYATQTQTTDYRGEEEAV